MYVFFRFLFKNRSSERDFSCENFWKVWNYLFWIFFDTVSFFAFYLISNLSTFSAWKVRLSSVRNFCFSCIRDYVKEEKKNILINLCGHQIIVATWIGGKDVIFFEWVFFCQRKKKVPNFWKIWKCLNLQFQS